jgi:hypothetical protein
LTPIERYNGRNPRDVMIAVEVKGATEADRKAVIAEGKKMVGRGYDNGFNTFDDRDIYCTEFIYKSWMASPDATPEFATQLHPLIPQTSAPVSGWLYDKVSDKAQTKMKDDGYLYQELLMTDGILTSKSVDLKWASQNADKSEFFKKHGALGRRYGGQYLQRLQRDVGRKTCPIKLHAPVKCWAKSVQLPPAHGKSWLRPQRPPAQRNQRHPTPTPAQTRPSQHRRTPPKHRPHPRPVVPRKPTH